MIDDLLEFLRFPSVSADSKYKPDVEACADWLTNRLRKAGLEASKIATPGLPGVLAKKPHFPGKKTGLIYGDYDFQPADPLELWETPPFETTVRGGRI